VQWRETGREEAKHVTQSLPIETVHPTADPHIALLHTAHHSRARTHTAVARILCSMHTLHESRSSP